MYLRSVAVLATIFNFVFSNPVSVKIRDDPILSIPGPVYLTGFDKCSTDQVNAIKAAWDDAIQLASNVRIYGGHPAENDFLGSRDGGFLTDVQTVIGNTAKWSRSISSNRQIHIRCDDPLRGDIDPPRDCPAGTVRADYGKCKSRCWVWNQNTKQFDPKAIAYTVNQPGQSATSVAYINFCPSFLTVPTCDAQISQWGNSARQITKFDLVNYICQGYVVLHELFHVDINYNGVKTPNAVHAYDRVISYFQEGPRKVSAYGPEYVRALANFGGSSANFYVLTNADSLALYCLSKWVQSKIGGYPRYPQVRLTPTSVSKRDNQNPDDDMPFALINQNNQMTVSSPDNLALALNTTTDALDDFDAVADECSDGTKDCINTSDNAPVTLVPNQNAPTSANPPSATSSSAPPPPPGPTDCTTVTTLIWEVPSNDPLASNSDNPNSDQWDTMGFKVSGKYTGLSSPATQVVWADQDTSAATPKLSSAPGPLPAFLVETYDHDNDWVQYNYGSQAWNSAATPQCNDPGWWNGPKAADGRPQRVITCTFSC